MATPALLSKLDTLFAQRQITAYVERVGVPNNDQQHILSTLQALQILIYEIDEFLETNWELSITDHQRIDFKWEEIETLVEHVASSCPHADHLLDRLRSFFQMEIQMREGISPLTIPIDAFYGLKICDIHLQREVTNCFATSLPQSDVRNALEGYDKIGEIIDDLEDITEDMDSINSNRCMIHIHTNGLEHTKDVYTHYIDLLTQRIVPFEQDIVTLLGNEAMSCTQIIAYAKRLLNNLRPLHERPRVCKLLDEL